MSTYTFTTTLVVDHEHPLAIDELAHACGAQIEWVQQLVTVGILVVPNASEPPQIWRFDSHDLKTALETKRLERDFGVALDVAALILDLQHEVRRLRTALCIQTSQA